MKICNNNYFTYNIDYRLQKHLNKLYGKKGKCKEITLPDHKHLPQRINLISCLIGKYAINSLLKKTRFYYIPFIRYKINKLMKYKFPDMKGNSVGDVIKSLQRRNIKVYIHGGLIRDMFLKIKSHDIDLIFDADIHKISKICEEENYPCGEIMIREQYVNFGSEKGNSLEGSNLRNAFLTQKHLHEVSVNDLVFDLQYNILIDITGFGLHDVVYRIFRLSASPRYWIKWAESDFKRPLRYFKLIQKGFTPLNNKMHNFVINYIINNYDNLYDKEINYEYPVKRIKHFIIKTITQGEIDEKTGKYKYGPTKNKLIPYLYIIKQYLPKYIFKKIIKIFTKDDMKMLKNKYIISTLQHYTNDENNQNNKNNKYNYNNTKKKKKKITKTKKK